MATAILGLKNDAVPGEKIPSAGWNAIADAVEALAADSDLLYAQPSVASGDTVASSSSETAFASYYQFPADDLAVGDVIEVEAYGVYGSMGSSPGNLTLALKWGSTVLLTTGAQALTASLTNRGWRFTARLIVRAIGASGSVEAQGECRRSTGAASAEVLDCENTATVTIDTTAATDLKLFETFSVSNASNTITLRSLTVRVMRA